MAIGPNIKRRREALGLDQKTAAKRADVMQSTWCDWEAGKMNPRVDRLPRIARVLKCEVAELLA
jgi:transcriptional regulator with XRE-family HTH domain